MNARLTRFFSRYGRAAVLTTQGGQTARVQAVVSPLRYKNRMYSDGEHSAAGFLESGYCTMVCPYTPLEASHGDTVTVSGRCYLVRRWDVQYLGERPVLVWAVLSAASGEESDGVL